MTVYCHFWDGMDGDGWCQDYPTEAEAMKAHQEAIKNHKTLESRVRLIIEGESEEIIAKWTYTEEKGT